MLLHKTVCLSNPNPLSSMAVRFIISHTTLNQCLCIMKGNDLKS